MRGWVDVVRREAEAKRHFYERENAEQRIYVAIFSPAMFVAKILGARTPSETSKHKQK